MPLMRDTWMCGLCTWIPTEIPLHNWDALYDHASALVKLLSLNKHCERRNYVALCRMHSTNASLAIGAVVLQRRHSSIAPSNLSCSTSVILI